MKPVLIDGGKGTLKRREDGVIHLIWQPKASLVAADIKAAMEKVNDVCNGLPCPLLVEMADIGTVSRDARESFATPCAASRIALLGANPVDRLLANFRGTHTHPCPTRFFTDRTEAMNWLLQDEFPQH